MQASLPRSNAKALNSRGKTALSLDVRAKLASALRADESEDAERWRAHVRHLFANVDDSELIRCAKNPHSNLYAALTRREKSSMYSIAIRSCATEASRMFDVGIVRDPEWFGAPKSEIGGLLLWVSSDYAGPLIEIVARLGFPDTRTFALDGGTAIDLDGQLSNDDLCDLARLAVVELISAFDITGKEWAQQDRLALAQAIHPGYPGAKQQTL